MLDPRLMAASIQQQDPYREKELAFRQSTVCQTAAMFILDHPHVFATEQQQHARDFIMRCMSLDNIKVTPVEAPPT